MRHRSSVLLAAAAALTVSACTSDPGSQAATTSPSPPGTTSPAASPTEASSGSETATATPSPRDQAVEIRVAVRDGKVQPKTRRVEVERDSRVRLLITSDVDDEVHVHGYDLEETLEAGRTTTLEMVADQPGVFEVETHESGLSLVQLQVG